MKIAVCLYGQYRTGDYCLPWIKEQYAFADVDYFVHTKAYSTYPNTRGQNPLEVMYPDVIGKQLRSVLGTQVKWSRILEIGDEHHKPGNGHWHYAPMFASLQQAVYAALAAYANTHYDVIIAQRLDMLVGPRVSFLADAARQYTKPLTVFTVNPEMRFMNEGMQAGIHDVFLAGTPSTMNLLVGETFEATACPSKNDWQRYLFEGPNVFLRKAAASAGLHLAHARVGFALVRPTADLTVPVFDSYSYHEKFWSTQHRKLPSE